METVTAKDRVLQMAHEEGFALVRIAGADVLEQSRAAALEREERGLLDGLAWMTDEWLTRATDPVLFLDGARSIVLCALPYARGDGDPGSDGVTRGRVAAYAGGRDYHRVFEKKLRRIAARIRDEFTAGARATVDYGPLLERPLAQVAGIGWQGKSTMLLAPGFGPWVLLGAVATTVELEPDAPLRKSCGSCVRCVVSCPTGALGSDGSVLDARLCISYHTIENRGVIPVELRPKFGAWIFGCDACLESCPVGAGSTASHPDFVPRSPGDLRPDLNELLLLDESAFLERFRGRPLMRAKRDGLVRNACIAMGNTGAVHDLPALLAALHDRSPLVRGHAAWAAAHLCRRLGDASSAAGAADVLRARLDVESEAWVREELAAAIISCDAPLPGGTS
ncbi:hypothetical protein AYO38_07680 [bacterium SCGC AG-212-C10]|nr:hypothetical protein AYO38_07680 [bacterium SCGC AG-212-C10]